MTPELSHPMVGDKEFEMQTHTPDLTTLREQARPVLLGTDQAALACARILFTPARQMTLAHGDQAMREGCAHLATGPAAAWPMDLRRLAAQTSDGAVRAALAFWAVVTDAATLMAVARQ